MREGVAARPRCLQRDLKRWNAGANSSTVTRVSAQNAGASLPRRHRGPYIGIHFIDRLAPPSSLSPPSAREVAAAGARACEPCAPLPHSTVRSHVRLRLASCTTQTSHKSHRTTWTRTQRSSARKVWRASRSIRAAPSSGLRCNASRGRCIRDDSSARPPPRHHVTTASVQGGHLYPYDISQGCCTALDARHGGDVDPRQGI